MRAFLAWIPKTSCRLEFLSYPDLRLATFKGINRFDQVEIETPTYFLSVGSSLFVYL